MSRAFRICIITTPPSLSVCVLLEEHTPPQLDPTPDSSVEQWLEDLTEEGLKQQCN